MHGLIFDKGFGAIVIKNEGSNKQNAKTVSALQQILPPLLCKISTERTSPGSSLATPSSCIQQYQIEENVTKVLMLPNTGTSPFCILPCLHAVESKKSQPPTQKKTCFTEKP
jgi:hypothetical protein